MHIRFSYILIAVMVMILDSELSMCSVNGEIHYRTFDGTMIPYQGRCPIDMATPVQVDPDLPHFSIVTRNERRYYSTALTYPHYIEIHVFDHVIRMEKDKVIRVS